MFTSVHRPFNHLEFWILVLVYLWIENTGYVFGNYSSFLTPLGIRM